MNFLLKSNDERNRRSNFAIFVVWSSGYASAETLECNGSISSSCFHEQLANHYSHDFSLIHPVDEFPFKEMGTWIQSEISSCCICVWCKSREMGGRGSPRFPTPMVESFSADHLPTKKVFGYSRIWNSVKYQQQTSSMKVCGAPLDDCANGDYVDCLLHVW